MSDDTHGLLTPTQFTSLTGRKAPSQEALDAALDVVEGWCQWPVLETTQTKQVETPGGRDLVLPAMNVTAVASVTFESDWGDTYVPSYRVMQDEGMLRAIRWDCWRCGVATVTFTSGYPPAPGGVWLTVAALADRLQYQAGVTQRLVSAGGISTNTSYGGMSGFMLANPDLAVSLAPYRLHSV